MKHKNFFLIVSTILLISMITACSSTQTKAEPATAGTSIKITLNSKSSDYIANKASELKKRAKKDSSLKSEAKQFENMGKKNYKVEKKLSNDLLETFTANATESLKQKGYIPETEFNSRYVIEGTISLEYGTEESCTLVEYTANLKLVDNENLPLDPSYSKLVKSHTELPSATNLSTQKKSSTVTWTTNGTARADSLKSAANLAIEKISDQFNSSFINKLM